MNKKTLKTNEEKNVEIGTMITELKTSMAEYREMAESNHTLPAEMFGGVIFG